MVICCSNCFSYSTVKTITHEWEILWAQFSSTGAGTNLLLLKFFTLLLSGRANTLSWTLWTLSKSPAFQKNHCLLSLDICKSKTFHVWKIKPHRKNHRHAKHNFENSTILACKMPDTFSQLFKTSVRRDGQITHCECWYKWPHWTWSPVATRRQNSD